MAGEHADATGNHYRIELICDGVPSRAAAVDPMIALKYE
jgi:hypothetical protein